jgi:hypothetical protein
MKRLLLISIIITAAFTLHASVPDSSWSGTQILPLPVIAYTPETDLILGATAFGQFKLKDSGHDTRSSNIITAGTYTLNHQFLAQFDHAIIFPHEKYLWTGSILFNKFPQSFWGIGANTRNEDEVLVDQQTIMIRQRLYAKICSQLFTGPSLRYIRQFDVSFETKDGDSVEYPGLTGNSGHTGIAGGWGILYDTRNSLMTPVRGSYIEINTILQHSSLGSTFSFGKIELDGRKYFDLNDGGSTVLGFHIRSEHAFGDVPFDLIPQIGGMVIMRGVYQGRYRDQNAVSVQTEIRQHVYRRIGTVAFISAGNVGPSVSDVFDSGWKYAGGGGVRFNVGKDEKTNIRLDLGIGPNMTGLYVTFGEAF